MRAEARRLRSLLLVTGALAAVSGCGGSKTEAEPVVYRAPELRPQQRESAVIRVRDFGEFRVELLADRAPNTVENFKKLVAEGFYDGTTFHRIVPGFMIQGGDPLTRDRDPRNDGMGGPGYTIDDEFSDVSHVRGVVSMANRGIRNTGGSQFFVTVGDATHLDGGYAAFGVVSEGMEVVDRIASTPRDVYGRHGPRDRPLENVVIESIRID